MPNTSVLIVDDEPSIRTTLSYVLVEIGYKVRTAEDGFSALAEIHKEVPDVLLSDLNMPGISGFDLLAVVRRRFPAIRTIAMSGAFTGDEMPAGVVADAFYGKSGGLAPLLKILGAPRNADRMLANRQSSASAPIWIERNGHNASGEPYVTICCPACLQTFPQIVGGALSPIREGECVYCRNTVYYAIVEPVDWAPAQASQRPSRGAQSTGLPQMSN